MTPAPDAVLTENTIEKVVVLAAPPSRVWRALTDHQEFGSWFRVSLDQPFAAGGHSTGRMTYPGFEGWPWRARIEVMEPERTFAFRWPHDPVEAIDYDTDPTTLVEFHLKPEGSGTRLTIRESAFEALPDPRRLEALRDNRSGWDAQAANIAAHVA
jgi:uncharacterized protein YndB with AHSA1/START domain